MKNIDSDQSFDRLIKWTASGAWILYGILLCVMVSRFADIYKKMNVTLPLPTQILISLQEWAGYWIIAGAILIYLYLHIEEKRRMKDPRAPASHFPLLMAIGAAFFVAVGLTVFFLFLPMLDIGGL